MDKVLLLIISCFATLLAGQTSTDWDGYIELYNEKAINTEQSEFSPTFWGDEIIFVGTNTNSEQLDKNTNSGFYDLFHCKINKAKSLEAPDQLPENINSTYHEGPLSSSSNSNEIIFTRVDYDKGKFKLTDKKEVALKLFSTSFQNGSWTTPQKHILNEENVAMAHPALSYFNDFLIFASDRPGGFGKMDLYISYKNGNGWSTPENLGAGINSSGNDWFPYINKRGYFFYASDGKENAKGLDIYMSKNNNRKWQNASRLPAPINSDFDDFGLCIDDNGTFGFVSSNRPGGKGKDDIYGFNSLVSLFTYVDADYNKVNVTVIDDKDKSPMVGVTIRYKGLDNKVFETFDEAIFDMKRSEKKDSTISNAVGKAEIILTEGYTLIEALHPEKKKWSLVMSNHGSKKDIEIILEDLEIEEAPKPEIIYIKEEIPSTPTINNVKVDVGAVIVFENIYYDYNSATLTRGAKQELDVLAESLLSNPRLKIQLSAHTDSRGTEAYNQSLSQQRADSAKNYLISRGIPNSNVTAIGYGETQPRNHCVDGVNCSEAEYIYNRRTEVKILQK